MGLAELHSPLKAEIVLWLAAEGKSERSEERFNEGEVLHC